jgi:hypothetical protein
VKVIVLKSVGLVAASDQRCCAFESFEEHLRVRKDCPPCCALCLKVWRVVRGMVVEVVEAHVEGEYIEFNRGNPFYADLYGYRYPKGRV